jgi:hypothetical protein
VTGTPARRYSRKEIGASFAAEAFKRGERVVFLDPEPRADFLRAKLGDKADYVFLRGDVRDLPALISAIQTHKASSVVHSAGLIGARVDRFLDVWRRRVAADGIDSATAPVLEVAMGLETAQPEALGTSFWSTIAEAP